MDYEKKYKDALEWARKVMQGKVGFVLDEVLEKFPELKESEDESVRKEIIATIHLYYGEPLEDEAKEMIAWLEKQGEQKPTIIIPKFRVGDEIKTSNEESLTITKIDEKGYWSEDLFICSFEDSAKWDLVGKLVDKVEPKFHEGDWIIHQGTENIYQVVAIIDNQYQLKYGDNYTVQKCDNVDRCARLWDVTKDAKDGDVLSYRDGQWIFIYKKLVDGDTFCYHALYSTIHQDLTIDDAAFTLLGSAITPATKEQSDTLVEAMTNAGYTFDFEKKELKKIAQNPVLK